MASALNHTTDIQLKFLLFSRNCHILREQEKKDEKRIDLIPNWLSFILESEKGKSKTTHSISVKFNPFEFISLHPSGTKKRSRSFMCLRKNS
jgi:hypothetical protein